MKNSIIICTIIIIYALSTSCEKMFGTYLEKAPGIDVTADTIFSNITQIETYMASAYYWGMHTDMAIWDERDKSDSPISGACEETETVASWFWVHRTWNTGGMSSTNQADMRWLARWKGIRIFNIILERIDKASVDDAYKTQIKGEARFLRALNYFEMFKHYGGVPIVVHSYQLTDDLLTPRSTLQATLDFILKDCDDAIAALPAIYPSIQRGRATKEAAYALKSKTLLFAASPQFNTATPVLDLPGHNDLICFGKYDPSRWQTAADAAKIAIDAAPSSGNALITNQGVTKNWKYIWEIMDNSEIILAEKSQSWRWFQYFLPSSIYSGMMGNTVTFNFVKYYEKTDGTPQTWNDLGGYDLNLKYSQLDPRFAQAIKVNGSQWNANYGVISTTTVPAGRNLSGCFGGAWCKKPIPDAFTNTSALICNWPVFKVNELYLNYAEALNEAQGPVQAAYDAVNIIRARSGMPNFPVGLTKDQFRTKLRNERAIELAFDAHRIFDERRWLISDTEGLMKGAMWGIKIYAITGNPSEFQYVPYVFSQRTFFPRMYLHPFMQTEVNKGYVIQNPGY